MWISPVRDMTAKDLAMMTHFKRLKTVPPIEVPQYGRQVSINGLAERFISALSEGMPSTVHAVLGTACKLEVLANPNLSQCTKSRVVPTEFQFLATHFADIPTVVSSILISI